MEPLTRSTMLLTPASKDGAGAASDAMAASRGIGGGRYPSACTVISLIR